MRSMKSPRCGVSVPADGYTSNGLTRFQVGTVTDSTFGCQPASHLISSRRS